MGFCTEEQTDRFLELAPGVEKAMVDSGIVLVKYWLEVSSDQQTLRLQSRIEDPRKMWKLSDMDLKSYSRWYDYGGPRRDVRRHRHGVGALARRADRRQAAGPAQPHHPPAQPGSVRAAQAQGGTLPARQKPGDYVEPDLGPRVDPDAVLTAWRLPMTETDLTSSGACRARPAAASRRLAILLAMAMFVLVVDTSLMNVSISAVVQDLDTTVSGVQSAIALEALVSAAFILIGSKVGDLSGGSGPTSWGCSATPSARWRWRWPRA